MIERFGLHRQAGWRRLVVIGWLFSASAAQAVDLAKETGTGPHAVATAEYRLAAKVDPSVAQDVVTEIWARVYRPANLSRPPYPLLVFLHGNHATCGRLDRDLGVRVDDDTTYTDTGKCPRGYVVTPNHEGYGYVARRLASWGYVVVSINANRGVNAADGVDGDWGLNLRRGRLVLRHLELLSGWSRSGGTPRSLKVDLRGKLDLGQIGLMGHSRGGEGMRAALGLLRENGSPWPERLGRDAALRALFEIGPVDGQTSRVLDADGIAWNVLLPLCDGDVSTLDGVRSFDRMLAKPREPAQLPKSTYLVWGANHNAYNTEWPESDSVGCVGHAALFSATGTSTRQQGTAVSSMVAFFRSAVGRERRPELATLLNPDAPLPAVVRQVTRIERGYSDTPDQDVSLRLEEFDQVTGRSSAGQQNEAVGIDIVHRGLPDHDPTQRAAAISWSRGGEASPYFQTNWAGPGAARDLRGYRTLELRLSEQCRDADYCIEPSPLNPAGDLDLSLALVKGDGSLSPSLPLKRYASVRRPGGIDFFLHPILQTVRIPLSDFGSSAGTAARGLRLTFDRSPSGAIHVANIRLSTRLATTGSAGPLVVAAGPGQGGPAPVAAAAGLADEASRIVAVRRVTPAGRPATADAAAAQVEIEVESTRRFPVSDALPELRVDGGRFRLSRFAGRSSGARLVFTLPAAAFEALPDDAEASVAIGAQRPWSLGRLRKAMLR